jgi:transposase
VIKVVDKEMIRRLHRVQGWSERKIAREFGFARMTVRKHLRDEGANPPSYKLSQPRARPVLDPVLPLIRQWFGEDEQEPRKQRRTAQRMYEQLRDEYRFTGSDQSVRRAVRELKRERRPVFVPLVFEPGERAEVDWGEAKVILAGRVTDVHLFCARLRYSGMPFVEAFPCERQEAFFEGHRRAFEYFGGVPRSVVYDNLPTAVLRVLQGRKRKERDAFVSLRMHYLYEAVFCNPASGHEKGSVENLVGTFRRRYLSPMPVFASFGELNEYLLECCAKEGRQTPEGRAVAERLELERRHLLSLPPHPFECTRSVGVKAMSTAEVLFETNRYSVPVDRAYRQLTLKAGVDTIRVYDGVELVAEHGRCYGRAQRVNDWRHYVPVLARKPGAVPFAVALRNGGFAPVYERFRRGLCERDPEGGNREFVRVLELCAEHPVNVVTEAVEKAVSYGACSVAAVEQLMAQLQTPAISHPRLDLSVRLELAALTIPGVSTSPYNALLGGRS